MEWVRRVTPVLIGAARWLLTPHVAATVTVATLVVAHRSPGVSDLFVAWMVVFALAWALERAWGASAVR